MSVLVGILQIIKQSLAMLFVLDLLQLILSDLKVIELVY